MSLPQTFDTRFLVLIALTAAGLASDGAAAKCELPTTLSHTVTAVSDSRSLKLDNGSELRLAAVLAPTPYDTPAAPKNWPAELEALSALERLALNRNVRISLERKARDRYGRVIGQVIMAGSLDDNNGAIADRWLQARLVRDGQARVALTPEIDEACAQLLLTLEAAAETNKAGLWRHAAYSPKRAEDVRELSRYRSTLQIVEGVVAGVSIRRSAVYLNFGTDWKTDFTVKLSRRFLSRANLNSNSLRSLRKSALRVRGWIERRNGPLVTVWRLEQIEMLSLLPTGQAQRYSPLKLLTALRDESQRTTNNTENR